MRLREHCYTQIQADTAERLLKSACRLRDQNATKGFADKITPEEGHALTWMSSKA